MNHLLLFESFDNELAETKVVNELGEPMVVWRSQSDDREQGVERQSKTYGIYFSADKESTGIYGKIAKPYHLNIKNPLVLFDKKWYLSIIPEHLYRSMLSQGYDGAIWMRNGIMYEIVAFNPSQIYPL